MSNLREGKGQNELTWPHARWTRQESQSSDVAEAGPDTVMGANRLLQEVIHGSGRTQGFRTVSNMSLSENCLSASRCYLTPLALLLDVRLQGIVAFHFVLPLDLISMRGSKNAKNDAAGKATNNDMLLGFFACRLHFVIQSRSRFLFWTLVIVVPKMRSQHPGKPLSSVAVLRVLPLHFLVIHIRFGIDVILRRRCNARIISNKKW